MTYFNSDEDLRDVVFKILGAVTNVTNDYLTGQITDISRADLVREIAEELIAYIEGPYKMSVGAIY